MRKPYSAIYAVMKVLIAILLSSDCLANSYDNNPDQAVNRRVYNQLNAIGQIQTTWEVSDYKGQKGIGVATAFLISPCLILTNNHAIFGDDFPPQPRNKHELENIQKAFPMKFRVGVGMTLEFEGSVAAILVAWGDRDGANREDWALLKLSSCVGKRSEIGYLETNSKTQSGDMIHEKIALVSFPFNRQDMAISYGYVSGYNCYNDTLRYTVSSAPQSSGGAVLVDTPVGVRVIGMHRGGVRTADRQKDYQFPTYKRRISNEFINIRDILLHERVEKLLKADLESAKYVNPNAIALQRRVPGLAEATPPAVTADIDTGRCAEDGN